VLLNLQDDWQSGARAVFLVLDAMVLIVSLFVLVLAYQVRRGRLWAWIVSLVVLPFATLFGALMVLITVVGHSVPWAGTGLVVSAVAAMLTLTVPRTARACFVRKPQPVYAYPGYPPAA
jgi:hypothetical protein